MQRGFATRYFPWLVLIPALVWFILFVAYPFGYSIVSSFFFGLFKTQPPVSLSV